jgi:hypothetical protein
MRLVVQRTATIALVGALMAVTLPPASAQVARPQGLQAGMAGNDAVTPVRWRGRYYYGGGYYRGGGAAVGAGIVAGALLGAGIAASRPYYGPGPYYAPGYYYAPPPVAYGDPVAYCMRRYRSYDPGSGTYLGYDGYRHPCP